MHALVQFAGLFMIRMFSAFAAILLEHDFFRRVDFVSAGDVVLGLTHGADHRKGDSLIFFRHGRIIAEKRRLLKQALCDDGVSHHLGK